MLALTSFKELMASIWAVVEWLIWLGVWIFGLTVAWRSMRAVERIADALEVRGPSKT
jgi:hypothetical protein